MPKGSASRRKLAKKEGRQHQKIARARKDFQYKTAHFLVRTGKNQESRAGRVPYFKTPER